MLERENSSEKTPLKSVLAQARKDKKATVSLKAYNQLQLVKTTAKIQCIYINFCKGSEYLG